MTVIYSFKEKKTVSLSVWKLMTEKVNNNTIIIVLPQPPAPPLWKLCTGIEWHVYGDTLHGPSFFINTDLCVENGVCMLYIWPLLLTRSLKSLPRAFKEATLKPILEPFPVSGVGKGLTHSAPFYINAREHTHARRDSFKTTPPQREPEDSLTIALQ